MDSSLYVIFLLGEEEYGIRISCAQEIIRIPEQKSNIPNMPSFVEGIINLRDRVIPIINLRKRFGYPLADITKDNRLLILDINNSLNALIVDDVVEIIKIEDKFVETSNSIITKIGKDSLKGIGILENRMILILNEEKLQTEVFKES